MRINGLIRLTHDPELREVEIDGKKRAVCTMRCAIRGRFGSDDGFVDVTAWRSLGERCAAHLTTGSAAFVDGHLRQEEWTTDDGERRQRHSIVADDVQFLGRPSPADAAVVANGVES